MKKILSLFGIALTAIAFVACSDDSTGGGGSSNPYGNLSIKMAVANSSNIENSKALAVGRKNGGSSHVKTRAVGDVETVKSLLKVSDDMKFIEVNYTFDVEVVAKDENGNEIVLEEPTEEQEKVVQTMIERVNTSLRISPNFIFEVGDYLWLSNCFYDIPGYGEMAEDPVKKILTKIRDDYNETHHDTHGGQFFIRKSDGAIFEWSIADGAPNSLGDGYNPQSMLNGWLHAIDNKIYVREGGYNMDFHEGSYPNGRVLCITDKGSELNYEEIIPATFDGKGVAHILPAGSNLGVVCRENVYDSWTQTTKWYPVPYIYNTSTKQLKPLSGIDVDENTRWSLITIAGEFYAVRNHHKANGVEEGDPNTLEFYSVDVNNATKGEKLYGFDVDVAVAFDDDKFFAKGFATTESTFKFIMSDDGQYPPVRNMCIFDPHAAGGDVFVTYPLPEHYSGSINDYIEGIGCCDVTKDGFYVCDLTKDAAEWVDLDWSDAGAYQNYPREYVHFEAANMSIKYEATTSDGKITLWVPITGEDRGKVTVFSDEKGNSYDVDVMIDM